MRNRGNPSTRRDGRPCDQQQPLPAPTPSYRRRAWRKFQRALDPLAPIKPLPPPRP